ncbi:hypothetical protein ILZ90_002170 [Escherichia coli]|nr:hypothetical protein [Escherichia coli]EET6312096.1 hypothetical protein [Escherichia coli]EFC8317411.1 hypothetical protein [Escherichia coli]EFM1904155.1 hypothetical protein [Escherichia coli]EFP5518869.1 hypothetical protein [Escherichia coli]
MFTEFPAPAGINRLWFKKAAVSERVPRASGDKPTQNHDAVERYVSSPRQRG